MFENPLEQPRRHRQGIGLSLVAMALALAACSDSSPSVSASASESAAGPPSAARCADTPDGSPSATVQIAGSAFGDEVTVAAGQAVVFTNQNGAGHTITEGTGGQPADGACVDESIGGGQSVIVTFNAPGDSQITCKIHPSMQTAVHVE
ncbi:MAG: plastocyanin/azurin family copper-binding protein [Candidatus Limnocylindria bacterium]